ncbi:hypothetical protein FHR22_004382 [Sphingopyxis panaciterrae]|uniref:hypothetical protein n=1 Tax=Sphingopyxis panaciterrae TaxID=363841 RepID=UPI001420B005|nr:hypothetical protein [Sphingopyxis panaciterrae]NIJ39630.1 hypothetical protein [Sphingopyxis panaciterrae]
MSKIRLIPLAALLACAAIPAATLAADPAPAGAATAKPKAVAGKKGTDPNEVVCRKEEVLGSRLQTRRVCMTRSEWADARNDTRGVIERAQVQRAQTTQ